MERLTLAAVLGGAALALSACGGGSSGTTARPPAAPAATSPVTTPGSATPTSSPSATASARPQAFTAKISKIPSRATVKYSWHSGCPVGLDGLRLIRMTYWGMDHKPHQGEMVVNARVAAKVVSVFHKLYDQRYPIRRMELVDKYKGSDFDSIEADNTSAFNCRNATGSSNWSQHAYGLAVDLNTCENPYVHSNGHIEHPRCVKYGDRKRKDPGVIHAGDKVVRAFRSIGWGWGGTWGGPWDFQHFSESGH
ncbi:M15 family metallopeptidase [Actinoallomurus soli]|uniref:M15 family metallopeptidase n=1 Tax=Actinoallomurus soli TaxID=2952535 RepID=UPI002093F0BF|nr:M15 family metallopeptidase [Actinoallomurus soli]MCO5970315.1 M15 family metallopeptidase [Actinoallomurus soli]